MDALAAVAAQSEFVRQQLHRIAHTVELQSIYRASSVCLVCDTQERKVAVDALATVAAQFGSARAQLRRIAGSVPGIPDSHAPDAFFQTVAAAGEIFSRKLGNNALSQKSRVAASRHPGLARARCLPLDGGGSR